jgi:Protein of unknown function (DUF732)
MRTAAKHRKQTQQPDHQRWWPLGLTVTVVGGLGTFIAAAPTVQDPAPVPTVPAQPSAAALPYRDSVNTSSAGDYLAALDKHGITVGPHTAVAVGHLVCSGKAIYDSSPAILTQQVRNDHPGITPSQAATIVEHAMKYLCNNIK